ncbi:stage V sporulation protein B [Clostridium pasteurianum]|uniref:Multidrug-efflux transporter n=1 Tax=Clostridium pasteurianum BC1 TaxID=86416 RepID=R4K6D2_CLOPA|nr:stage V sporulation protein B [Clostridium pasteurianum]AGK98103.1 stage V sporulation protein B [Clostridium pasteurianum BC1]
MQFDNFYKDTIILTISNLATGILRFVFSIILSNKLGAEGLGLYSIIMPIYDLFCCVVCGGMIIAVSRKAAIFSGNKDYINVNKLIRIAIIFDLLWSVFISVLVFFNSSFVASFLIKDSRTLYSIEIICPALIFVALSSILKGYFYGISKAKIPAYIDIFEKAIRICVVIGIVNILMLKTMVQTISAVYAALTFGELISFLMLYVAYLIYRGKLKTVNTRRENKGQLLFDILIVAIPLCINGFLGSILNTASTLVLPRRLVAAGINYDTALSLIGKFTGMALNITFFPMVVIMAMSTVLVPDISRNLSKKNYYALEERIREVLKISFYLGIATMIICLCIPNNLGKLFFNRNDLGVFIVTSALCLPITYAAASTYSILSGLGKQTIILINSMLVSVEELVLLYILTAIPSINIYSFAITLFITGLTSFILNIYEIKKVCPIGFSSTNALIDIMMSILVFLVLGIMDHVMSDSIFISKNVLIIITGFLLYFLLTMVVKEKIIA